MSMNILTVRDNLKQTIANKEEYLAAVLIELKTAKGIDLRVLRTTRGFLEISIQELKQIFADVEQCFGTQQNQ
jgi:hypothetical protein